MTRFRALSLSLVLVAPFTATPASAQCDIPNTALTPNPTRIALTSVDHLTRPLDGTEFLITAYEVRYYQEGAPSPFQTLTIPRDQWSPVAGQTNCYTATPSSWPLTPNLRYRAVVIAKASPLFNTTDSDPSEESNPFGRAGRPQRPVTRVP